MSTTKTKPPGKPRHGLIPQPPPWANAIDRVIKPFGLRMPEPLHAKLKFVADNTAGVSMHDLALGAVSEMIERRLAEIDRGK